MALGPGSSFDQTHLAMINKQQKFSNTLLESVEGQSQFVLRGSCSALWCNHRSENLGLDTHHTPFPRLPQHRFGDVGRRRRVLWKSGFQQQQRSAEM